ncbi:MAG: hypothetical protein IJ184_06745 [Alphaproteobacteria bacterium]|nr:hypothetical protein [Alphaproteobacteria bacterium]
MKIRIYLSGLQCIDHEANDEEVNRILAEYDNTDKKRITMTDGFNWWHLAKDHIVAIQVEPKIAKRKYFIPESPTKH